MRNVFLLFVLLISFSCSTYKPYTQRTETVTTQFFYDELSPYGDWVHNREYGYVWIPHTGRSFYPYASNGRWILTDYGWTWLSDYQWGWAVFHYGRWDFDPQYGWFWFPGDEWAPAWVVWRQGNGYYGWAPLSPESGIGWDYRNDDMGYRWVFVREKDFGRSNIHRYYVNSRRNDEILRSTRIISDARRYAAGPDPGEIENTTGRRIRKISVTDSYTPGRRISKNQLEIYRPKVVAARNGQRPAPPNISDVKDIRPMRERNRSYQPEDVVRENSGQGERDVTREQVQNRREKDVQRQYQQKQNEMQRRQKVKENEQRQAEQDKQQQNSARQYEQNRSERIQRTEQQKKVMQKQREKSDTSGTGRSEKIQNKNVRQNRR
ncbi:MAG TPA: DUF6600 domain-containing protein [Bacteroidales bacterium]|nr:DUF6600 domain-containing protein [Bacteroidales bacterium]